jgi:uncharacterized protein
MRQSTNNYHLFEKNGSFFLFLINSVKIYEINDKTYKQILKDDSIIDKFDKTEENCETQVKIKTIRNNDTVQYLYFTLSHNCNLACKYCFASCSEMSGKSLMDFATARKSLDFFFQNERINQLYIILFGGEPLLNYKVLRQIINYAYEKRYNIRFIISTNGIQLNRELVDFFVQMKTVLHISLDGLESQQMFLRPDKQNSNYYRTLLDNIDYLKSKSVSVDIRLTLTKVNTNLNDIFTFYEDIGITTCNFDFVSLPKKNPLTLDVKDLGIIKSHYSTYI